MKEWVAKQIAGGSNFRVYDIEKANAMLQTEGYLAEVGTQSDGFRDTITEIDPTVKKFSDRDYQNVVSKAVKQFGTTTEFEEAGFILPSGEMLKFTDDNHRGERQYDHRAIGMAASMPAKQGKVTSVVMLILLL